MKYLFIIFIAAGVLVACSPKTTEVVVVEEAAEETSASSTDGEMPKADIGEGKVLFLTDCIGCHGSYAPGPQNVEEIQKFTKEQIDAALPRMIKNANFNEVQARQVTAYLHWQLEN